MHFGRIIGISISLKQIGQSALSSPLRLAMKLSANLLEPPSVDWPSWAKRAIRSLTSTLPPLSGDNALSSFFVRTRCGWRTARRSLMKEINNSSMGYKYSITSLAWPKYECNSSQRVLSRPIAQNFALRRYKWSHKSSFQEEWIRVLQRRPK